MNGSRERLVKAIAGLYTIQGGQEAAAEVAQLMQITQHEDRLAELSAYQHLKDVFRDVAQEVMELADGSEVRREAARRFHSYANEWEAKANAIKAEVQP